jgi:hypothetical protein
MAIRAQCGFVNIVDERVDLAERHSLMDERRRRRGRRGDHALVASIAFALELGLQPIAFRFQAREVALQRIDPRDRSVVIIAKRHHPEYDN